MLLLTFSYYFTACLQFYVKYVGFSANHELYYENLFLTCHSWYTVNNNNSKIVSELPTAMSFVISVVATSITVVSSVAAISVMAAYKVAASVVAVSVATSVIGRSHHLTSGQRQKLSQHHYKNEDVQLGHASVLLAGLLQSCE
jgi:hypothetical protein